MEVEKTAAEKWYENHRNNVRNYQKRNPEKMKEKCQNYLKRLKEERPEDYEKYKEKKRDYYNRVTKPKRQQAKQQQTGREEQPN